MVKKQKIGIVISNKAKKTISVAIQIRYSHPKYLKTMIKTRRYMAHDESQECNLGDLVIIEESAPFSKHKKWKLNQIIKRSNN
jgi:small subunit ribosomal protein S17